jgi:transposase-like protein
MQRSRKWWREHYDNYLSSNLSIAAYSSNNNIKKSTFYSWIKKFRKENTIERTKPTKVQWATIEATVGNNETTNKSPRLKITIGKAVIEIAKDLNPKLLDLAIKVLLENA